MVQEDNQAADGGQFPVIHKPTSQGGICNSINQSLITLFVDNLPEGTSQPWLKMLFNKYGVVKEVFIPNKRSKVTGNRFGFIRYDCPVSAELAIFRANGLWLDDKKLFVKLASFDAKRNRLILSYSNRGVIFNTGTRHTKKQDSNVNVVAQNHNSSMVDDTTRNDDRSGDFSSLWAHKSSADVVAHGKRNISDDRFTVQASYEDRDWLNRSAVGKLPGMRNVDSLRDAFFADGVTNIQLRDLGGNLILLTFVSVEEMLSMLEESGLCWLRNWFVDVKRCSPSLKFENKRTVWLSCYGVPLHLWNADTFFSIGKCWGDSITLDDDTSNGDSFSVGKVKIHTDTFDAINQVITLVYNGNSYSVRVVEEQGVGNVFMKAYCVCRGRNIRRKEEENSVGNLEKDDDVVVNGDKVDNFVISDKGDQAQLLNLDVVDNSNSPSDSMVVESCSPFGYIHCSEDPNQVEASKEPNLAVEYVIKDGTGTDFHNPTIRDEVSAIGEAPSFIGNEDFVVAPQPIHITSNDSLSIASGANENSDTADCPSVDLVSTDPLSNYVDYLRHKKKVRSKKGIRRKHIWSKNPLKTAMFSRTTSRDLKENNSRRLKLGLHKGSNGSPTLSSQEEANSRIRNLSLIKEARKSMEVSTLCGVKFFGRKSYNIKKYLESYGIDISEQDIIVLEKLEDEASISVVF